ncbi:MAG: L,D-transpeptidase family protein [Planctomycetota bacterium]
MREGDRQVPEGLYGIEYLNPNGRFHLSMKLTYPNEFDQARAEEDGRDDPGTNIFIHGKDRSIGCLAIGDESIEELFVLAATVGKEAVSVVVAPYRPSASESLKVPKDAPHWTVELYRSLDTALSETSRDT